MSVETKPKVNIKGGVQDLQKKERKVNPDRIRTSAFFLSVNTNQPYKPNKNDENLQNDSEVFESVMTDVLNHIDQYIIIPEGDWNDDKIVSTDVEYVIEVGTQKNMLHFHGLIKFRHKTAIKLDYKKIKAKICTDLGLKNIHLDNKIVKANNEDNIIAYIDKYKK